MRIGANERPYPRGLVLGGAPKFLWEIRRAPPMLEQRKLQAVRRSQNQIVFQRVYPGCFLPGGKGAVHVRSATASWAGEGSGKFRAGNRQRMCPIRFSFEGNPPHEVSRRRRSEERRVGKECRASRC